MDPRALSGAADARPGAGDLRSVAQAARALGVTPRTLRFYEDKGLLTPQRAGTARVYGRRELARLQLILRGKRLGFALRDIRQFLDLYDIDPRHRAQTGRLLELVRVRLAALAEQRAALDQTVAELEDIQRQAQAHLAESAGSGDDPPQKS